MFANPPKWKRALQQVVYVHLSTRTCKTLWSNLLNQGLPAFSCLSPFLVREGLHSFDMMREAVITRICSTPACYQIQCQSSFSRLRSLNYCQIWLFLQLLLNRLFPEVPVLGVILKGLFLLHASKCSAFMRCLACLFHGSVLWVAVGYRQHLFLAYLWHGSFLELLEPIIPGTTPQGHRELGLGIPAFWLKSNRLTPSAFPVFHGGVEINSSDGKFLGSSFP